MSSMYASMHPAINLTARKPVDDPGTGRAVRNRRQPSLPVLARVPEGQDDDASQGFLVIVHAQ